MAKPIRALELHYQMIQFLINYNDYLVFLDKDVRPAAPSYMQHSHYSDSCGTYKKPHCCL